MKNFNLFLFSIVVLTLSFTSCKVEDPAEPSVTLKDIELTTTQNSTSITLSWEPVSECSWYAIYSAKSGETMAKQADYQDLTSIPITYTITNLTPNTSYDIKLEGSDYLYGGEILASRTISASTTP